MKLWGGRFRKGENKLMEEFNKSFGFDCVLYKKDIEGSLAHVYMQVQVGLLTEEEGKQITEGLQGILADIESGKLALSGDYEDIHSFIEIKYIVDHRFVQTCSLVIKLPGFVSNHCIVYISKSFEKSGSILSIKNLKYFMIFQSRIYFNHNSVQLEPIFFRGRYIFNGNILFSIDFMVHYVFRRFILVIYLFEFGRRYIHT